jgi:hypothetical protein
LFLIDIKLDTMSDQELESNNSANTRGLYFCYRCQRRIEALMAPSPTCPHCNDGFVIEVSNFIAIDSDTTVSSNDA